VYEPFGVGGVGGVEDAGTFVRNGVSGAVVDACRGVQAQAGVAMLVVVSAEEALAVQPRGLGGAEAVGEVGPVLQRLELRLAGRVVVADVRPRRV
jgi:hypothetical protein